MSDIYKIAGNFEEKPGVWARPEPAFTGEFVLRDDGTFYGYCDENYESIFPNFEENKIRFLAGALTFSESGEPKGLVFYKFSNFSLQNVLLYVFDDLSGANSGVWNVVYFEEKMYLSPFGKANVSIIKEEYSPELEAKVIGRYDQIDCSKPKNRNVADKVEICKRILAGELFAEVPRELLRLDDGDDDGEILIPW